MTTQERKNHPLLKILNNSLLDLPTPLSISYLWNMGFLLGMCLSLQIITGIMVSMHYTSFTLNAFQSVIHISRDVGAGWTTRFLHMNGASLFFALIYIHMARGAMFGSPNTRKETWSTGMLLLLLTMATAFLGYVLPWGQMSFWGATVITNIFSAIPYLGKTLVEWMWGNFSVSQPTLTRFFSLHFLLPFGILAVAVLHLMFLHQTGSSNPLGSQTNLDKIPFHPFFLKKDTLPIVLLSVCMMMLISTYPVSLGDPENYTPANPMVTPIHIQPEWYFLFAYAILRSIPSKLGGVVALLASVTMLLLPMKSNKKHKSIKMMPLYKTMMWSFIAVFWVLTWIGANPVEPPYEAIGMINSTAYFMLILIISCFLKNGLESHLKNYF